MLEAIRGAAAAAGAFSLALRATQMLEFTVTYAMTTRSTAKSAVESLVKRFAARQADYLHASYNETQLRLDFLDPFFSALGWDIANNRALPQHLREVLLELPTVVEAASKKPDYTFRGAGQRKFFVEAKKPSIPVTTDSKPAFQLRCPFGEAA